VDGDAVLSGGKWVVATCHRYPEDDDTARPANVRLIAAAPELLALAHQYASECGDCAGTRVCPDDESCAACADIWRVIDAAERTP
jgi:hypothetical protein